MDGGGHVAVEDAPACADGPQLFAELRKTSLLAQRPVEPVAQQRSRHADKVEATAVGEAQGLRVEAAAGVVERDFFGITA